MKPLATAAAPKILIERKQPVDRWEGGPLIPYTEWLYFTLVKEEEWSERLAEFRKLHPESRFRAIKVTETTLDDGG